ncbi:late embryogenesis abundant protein [Striga asiatica]|uniref:Late embryogenesis abundant protein n=1 Tax=Striga asiatica TaxID=4170 RepID=A0A5A7PF82_STRAF|nr:late embryogenesis abundant protein [Striga asiatica]
MQKYDRTTNISSRVSTQSEAKSLIPNATRDAKDKMKTTIDRTKSSSIEPGKHIEAKVDGMKFSGSSRKKPRAQVTWRVPHEKRGEKEPGFNLDYLPPKTHPGIHN